MFWFYCCKILKAFSNQQGSKNLAHQKIFGSYSFRSTKPNLAAHMCLFLPVLIHLCQFLAIVSFPLKYRRYKEDDHSTSVFKDQTFDLTSAQVDFCLTFLPRSLGNVDISQLSYYPRGQQVPSSISRGKFGSFVSQKHITEKLFKFKADN